MSSETTAIRTGEYKSQGAAALQPKRQAFYEERPTSGDTAGEVAATSDVKRSGAMQTSERPVSRIAAPIAPGVGNRINVAILDHAIELAENLETDNAEQYAINLYGLRGSVADLWDSAIKSSSNHQDLLAIVESLLICNYELSFDLREIVREGLRELSSVSIPSIGLELLRERSVRAGHQPMGGVAEHLPSDADSD